MNFLKEKKIEGILILTIIVGFILRLINVNTRMFYGDPAHFVVNAINFLNSGLLSLWDQSTFLWYVFTDISYKIFGITQFSSRFAGLFFGTLTILAMYLFVKEFSGNKKIALISSMLYAFLPIMILSAADEQDIPVLFFIISTFYALIKGLNNNSKKYLLISGVLFGIGCMIKIYVAVLIIPYLGMILYYNKTKKFEIKKNVRTLIYIALIMFLIVSPTLVYNYLNFKYNGVPTFFFVKFLGGAEDNKIKEMYGWVSAGELYREKFSLYEIFIDNFPDDSTKNSPGLWLGLKDSLYPNAPYFLIFCLIGLILMLIKKGQSRSSNKELLDDQRKEVSLTFERDYLIFYGLYFIIPFLFLIESNTLTKHYIQFVALAIPFASYLIYKFYEKIKDKKIVLESEKRAYLCFALLIILLFFTIWSMGSRENNELIFSSNPQGQLMKYKAENIPEKSLIIYDERIYNSEAGWLFNDRNYISVVLLNDFLSLNQKSDAKENVPLYLIECAADQCGWPVNPELNQSMEGFFDNVKAQSSPVFSAKSKLSQEYYNPIISKNNPADYVSVYKTSLDVDLRIAKQIKMQYNYFMYPLGYENKELEIFKNFVYDAKGIDRFLNGIGWIFFYLDIILMFAAVVFILIESHKSIKN